MKRSDLALLTGPLERAREGPAPRQLRGIGLSPACSHVLQELRHELGFEGPEHSDEDLSELICRISSRVGLALTNVERDEILSEIERDRKVFGILEDLVNDPAVSDILVTDYSRISVQHGRRNSSTGLAFPNQESYESFVERLLQRAGTTYSTKKPIADGMIAGFARVHAVHRALCDSGPYLTIRLNRFASVSSRKLIEAGLAPRPVFDYLEAMVQHGQTLLIVGEVGTGKTTLARALAASAPLDEAILVIEDTPEIRLEHPHVRYIAMREANSEGAGRVSPSECIRAGMRMAMNRIIFGEIRDAEAAESFIDVCASGHPGLSTIHARSASETITRLELFLGRAQRGAARQILAEQVATAVQAIVFVNICGETGRRRVFEVREIGPVADGVIRQREIFRYQLQGGTPGWRVVNRVSAHRQLLESGEKGIALSGLPAVVELEPVTHHREAARRVSV